MKLQFDRNGQFKTNLPNQIILALRNNKGENEIPDQEGHKTS